MRRILVVDDETPLRDMLVNLLKSAGYEVLSAADGGTAVGMLRAQPFDLLVTDLSMNPVSGADLAAFVTKENLQTRVIVMTGYNTAENDAVNGQNVFACIGKPFRIAAFLDLVKQALS